MIRTQVYLDNDLYTQIRIRSQMQSVPAASLIRKYIRAGIAKTAPQKLTAGQALLRIAKHAAKHGPKDLSTNHDYYLYEEN